MRKVAIITRTLNRPLLLQRTAESILDQTFEDYCWVVVNNGAVDPVENITSNFTKEKIVIHNAQPRGMTASTNIGLKASESEFVVLLDDDDTWHPRFLEKTTEYLDSLGPSDIQQGVVTHFQEITEEIVGNSIHLKKTGPCNTGLAQVALYNMLESNFIATNSFLYRRKVFEDLDYYNEDLLMLGDWEFNIRFLLKYNIGLIPEILANYHKRENLYANSSKVQDFKKYHWVLRTHFLRKDIQSGTMGIGYFMNIAPQISGVTRKIQELEQRIGTLETSQQETSNFLQAIMMQLQNIESWPNILPTPIKNAIRRIADRSKVRRRVMIFAPHSDDAPLSLGGTLVGRFFGDQVSVVIVFSKSNYTLTQPGTAPELETTALRKREELQAAKFAHYKPNFLDFKEALLRSDRYQLSNLCDPAISVQQDPIYLVLKEKIKSIISSYDGLICAPISYGDHIDHRLIHAILEDIYSKNQELPMIFYEDLPYAHYVLNSNPKIERHPIFTKFTLYPYFFSQFGINLKRQLLEIYKSQITPAQIRDIIDYWKAIGSAERLWLTEPAKKLLKV